MTELSRRTTMGLGLAAGAATLRLSGHARRRRPK